MTSRYDLPGPLLLLLTRLRRGLYRFVDDTFVLIYEYNIEEFTAHINSLDTNIKFTTEPELDYKLPFLDTCIHINDDGSTKVTIYRKPTHTDQYLNFDFNHHLEHKQFVVRTLVDRVEKLVTTPDDQVTELLHVKAALKANGYKEWMYKTPKAKKKKQLNSLSEQTNKVSAPLPYIKGLSEKLTNIYRDHGVSTYHVPINTIRSILVHPKDKTPDANKCGVVCKFSCPQCTDTYVGETSRSLGTRFKEHSRLKPPLTAIGEHCKNHNHNIKIDDVQVVAREEHFWKRKIREAIEIRTQQPSLNRDAGHDLPAIYDDLLSHDLSQTGGHVTRRASTQR